MNLRCFCGETPHIYMGSSFNVPLMVSLKCRCGAALVRVFSKEELELPGIAHTTGTLLRQRWVHKWDDLGGIPK